MPWKAGSRACGVRGGDFEAARRRGEASGGLAGDQIGPRPKMGVRYRRYAISDSMALAIRSTSLVVALYSSETCSWLLLARKNSSEDAASTSATTGDLGSRRFTPAHLWIAFRESPNSSSFSHSLRLTIWRTRLCAAIRSLNSLMFLSPFHKLAHPIVHSFELRQGRIELFICYLLSIPSRAQYTSPL
jgi:hypothetical protein